MDAALLLGELQMWWEPSWEHLQAMQRLCSPQKFSLRREQLQSLALNDASCRCSHPRARSRDAPVQRPPSNIVSRERHEVPRRQCKSGWRL